MSDEFYYIYNGPLDEVAFRKWAYDTDMHLMEQDEDLLIGQHSEFHIWFDILKDKSCPKYDYILGCIDFHLKYLILWRQDKLAVSATRQALKFCNESDDQKIRFLAERLKLRLSTSLKRGPVSKEQAIAKGRILIMCNNQIIENIEIISEKENKFIVGQKRFNLRLAIDKQTGDFQLHHNYY